MGWRVNKRSSACPSGSGVRTTQFYWWRDQSEQGKAGLRRGDDPIHQRQRPCNSGSVPVNPNRFAGLHSNPRHTVPVLMGCPSTVLLRQQGEFRCALVPQRSGHRDCPVPCLSPVVGERIDDHSCIGGECDALPFSETASEIIGWLDSRSSGRTLTLGEFESESCRHRT
jgi:hypothetical protein